MKKLTIIILSLMAVVTLIIVIFNLNKEFPNSSSAIGKDIDKNLLVGNWLRTDSDYRINISRVNEDFTLDTQYFNPQLITVGKASWEESYGNVKLTIELRDDNYPGSTYTLNYVQVRDVLKGEYYQAVEGLIFLC